MFFRPKIIVTPTRLITVAVVGFVLCMVLNPTEVFAASRIGVSAWWNLVFPALLPFFISSEMLMGYGVIQFMGVLLEPVMRPLFNQPGAGSFVLAVGYTSGFPISASLSARLRKDGLCTRFEAERLMCFTNNASPLFMLVAVGVGMFHNARLGVVLALCHYAANLVLGLLLRFYKQADPEFTPRLHYGGNLFRKGLMEMRKAFGKNPRPFSRMLGDAIYSSVNKLLVIGGFVIIFSVIIRLAQVTGVMAVINSSFGLLTSPLGFSGSTVQALGSGFFEVTLGTKAASEAAAPLAQKAVAAGILLGWSGISVLAQVSAMISETDLKMGLFTVSRIFHGLFSGFLCYLTLRYDPVRAWLANPATAGLLKNQWAYGWFATLSHFTLLCLSVIVVWILAGVIIYLAGSLSLIRMKVRK